MSIANPTNRLTRLLVHNLFLKSHGIRDPLTIIRWGMERLRKGNLPPKEQERYIDEISAQAKILSSILESSLLVEELEEHALVLRAQDVCLPSFLRDLTQSFGAASCTQWNIDCPHIHISIDYTVLQTILRNILIAGLHFSSDPLIFSLQVKEMEEGVTISIYAFLVVPTLSGEESPFQAMPTLIVGPPGLLISLADLLAASCSGSVEVEKKHHGDFVSAATLSDDDLESTAKHYRLVCRLNVPVRGMGEDAACGA